MSRRTTYIIRYTTPLSMGDLVVALEKTGTVEHVQVKDSMAKGAAKSVAPKKELAPEERRAAAKERDARHPELVERRKANLKAAVDDFRIKVIDTLIPIMRANQHAPMDTLVREMNRSGVKNYRGGAWDNKSLVRHVEAALVKLTTPESTS